jgi:branched-chain amino acid transport system permease protein
LPKFDMGDSIGQKAFFAAIIGGFNQTRGALLGGVLIGVLENVVGFYFSPAYKEGVALAAVPARDPVPTGRPAGQGRGAQGMNSTMQRAASSPWLRRSRCSRVPQELRRLSVHAVLRVPDGDVRLNLTVGYAGQMSLGQAAFLGIGAYIAAIALKAGLAVPRRAADGRDRVLRRRAGARLPGVARAAPLPRVRDARLQHPDLSRHAQRGEDHRRTFGISGIPRPSLFGYSLEPALPFFWFTLFFTLLVIGLLWWLLRSPWGRAFAALARQPDPRREHWASTSLPTHCSPSRSARRARASRERSSPRSCSSSSRPRSTSRGRWMMLLAVIVGGSGKFLGPVLGTVIIVLLPEWLRFMQNWYLAVFGFAVVALMIWLPGGLLSIPEKFAKKGGVK